MQNFIRPMIVAVLMLLILSQNGLLSNTVWGQTSDSDVSSDELREAKALSEKVVELYGEGKYPEATEIAKRALKIREKALGPEHPDTGTIINNLALLYETQGDYAAAEPLYQRALVISEKTQGPDHPETATSLNNLAVLYNTQANYDAAEPLFLRALKIQEKALGPDDSETATTVNNLAQLYQAQGRYADAEPLFQRALRICEATNGPDHLDTATFLSNLSVLYIRQANYAAAEPLCRRALEIREKSLEPDHPHIAISVNNLAFILNAQADYDGAEPLYRRALEIREKTLGAEHPETSNSLNNLAFLYRAQHNYAAAEPLYQRALAIREASLGPEHPGTATSLNNLATLYRTQANYAAAEPLFQRALRITEKVLGAEHPDTATILNNLAHCYLEQADFTAAEPLFKRAVEIWKTSSGPDHPHTATGLNNLAELNRAKGNFAASAELHQQVLKIREAVLDSDHPDIAQSLNNLAEFYRTQRDFKAAEPLYRRAIEILEKSPGADHPLTATGLINLSMLQEAKGETSKARDTADRARQSIRRHVTHQLPMLSEKEQELFLTAHHTPGFEVALSLGLHHSDDPVSARMSAEWLVNGKAVGQEALAQRNLLTRDTEDPELADRVRELLRVRTKLADVAMSAVEADQRQRRLSEIEKLSAKEQRLSRELGLLRGGITTGRDWIALDELCRKVPAGTALIDIARFDVFDFSARTDESKWKSAHYAAWITVSPDDDSSTTVLGDLGLADEIDEILERVRRGLQSASGSTGTIAEDGEEAATAVVMQNLNALTERIWKPLEKHLGDCKKIVLSPDGSLWLAPWNALPIGASSDRFLLEDYEIRFAVSGRDLVSEPAQRTASASVILANPTFDQNATEKASAIKAIFREQAPEDEMTTRSFSAKNLLAKVPQLPNTGIEALAIQPNIETYAGIKPVLYSEGYALESIAKKLRGPRIATFATHGFFLPFQEIRRRDRERVFGSESDRAAALDVTGKPIENPLLRCGILLAGCNNRDAAVGNDDGILTGMEIVSIDFRGTELVVLSACETGIGDVKNGEGVAGLRQAFQLAGAEAVVSTLWQVPDRDSALLMSKFFEELAAGKTRSEALRSAQLERIEKRRERYGAAHPFFWAAFTLTGQ
jgi:CHAT domain-containing protein/tetratricopeptide (TPR) repeat protein